MAEKRGPERSFDIARLRELVDAGAGAREIAAAMQVSRQRIYQVAAREGIALKRPAVTPPLAPEPAGGAAAARRRRPGKAPVNVPRLITGGVPLQINSTATGRVAEILVMADLIARGWHVYAPLLDSRRGHDLIACGNGRMVSFEVRSGRRRPSGVKFDRDMVVRSDHYAIVVTGEPVAYDPPLEDLGEIDYRRWRHDGVRRDGSTSGSSQ